MAWLECENMTELSTITFAEMAGLAELLASTLTRALTITRSLRAASWATRAAIGDDLCSICGECVATETSSWTNYLQLEESQSRYCSLTIRHMTHSVAHEAW